MDGFVLDARVLNFRLPLSPMPPSPPRASETLNVLPAEPAAPPVTPSGSAPTIFAAGTLRYTRQGLQYLFFCLLWNDLCLMLMEQVAPQLTPLLLKDAGASNAQIGFFTATLTGALTIWINPVFSTWSDRHRGPLGRRRPFLLAVTPFCAIFLALIPFMPDLARWVPAVGATPLIGVCYAGYAIFNAVLLALFTYFFWDVVPEVVLGRFSSLTKMVSTLAVFTWNFWLFGLAANHMKAVFSGTAAFFAIVYLLSVWQVKEGDYPPPEPTPSAGPVGWLKSYVTDCFSHPTYRWMFAAFTVYQVGNVSNVYQIFFLRDQLGMSMETIGRMRSWPSLGVVVAGYFIGTLVDRWKPARLAVPSMALFSVSSLLCFLFLRGPWTLLACSAFGAFSTFALSISQGVLMVELFPREKLGQFCSANSLVQQIACFAVATPVGLLMDRLHDYRYAYLWSATCQALSACIFWRVYRIWRARQPDEGSPPADAVTAPATARC